MELFGNIVGQNNVVKRLVTQIKSGEIFHAYLFLGPEGSGKEFLARELAKYILCDDYRKKDCASCKKFERNAHPDFIIASGEDGIKIEQVREMIERINLSPNLSERKVLLLSGAENMGHEAANAMLKTFEEPPADSVIILTAASTESLPKTIMSRAQIIKLQPLTAKDIEGILEKNYSGSDVASVIEFAQNNLGQAKKLLENPQSLSEKKLMLNEIKIIADGSSIIEKFNILEKYDKEKNLGEFWDTFSFLVFGSVAGSIRKNSDDLLPNLKIADKMRLAKKMLQVNANMKYNVNLRLALEEIILEYFSPIGA